MKILEVKSLAIPDVKVITYARFKDDRGYFSETFRNSDFQKVIPGFSILQVNESYSLDKGVVRGLHFQWDPYMGKLIRTIRGHMVDLFLDIRKNSPTYGKIAAYDMHENSENNFSEWIWIPVGFAHGNFFLEETTIEYFCTGEYSPTTEAGISPFSKELDWSLCNKELKTQFDTIVKNGAIVSEKDKKNLSLKEWGNDLRSENFIYGKV